MAPGRSEERGGDLAGERPPWIGRLGIGGPWLLPRLILAGLFAFLLLWLAVDPPAASEGELGPCAPEELLYGIRQVESGGRDDPPDGDDGLAIGPYQIHRAYWIDSGIPGRYQDCRDRQYAERVVIAYMQRYVPEAWAAGDAEVVARTHNGGPRGPSKRATDRYWARVRSVLLARRRAAGN